MSFFFNKQLMFSLLVLGFVACSSADKFHSEQELSYESQNVAREIAQAREGIQYPASQSFRMSELRGSTYIHQLKTKIKPALDRLSDRKNGGGGGFDNIGSGAYFRNSNALSEKTLLKYRGAKWNRAKRIYSGALDEAKVEAAYEMLKRVKPRSTVDSLSYFKREDKQWPLKNDMAVALKEARIDAPPFDLATLYALTGGFGVKVKLDDKNYNYHVLYKTGKTDPHQEVMSGRSFASSPKRGVADATDPEYLRDLAKYLQNTQDLKPFYRALVLSLANSDMTGLSRLSPEGQMVLGDFFTVYTAEAVRHLMVDLQDGMHPWEIDLAAVTFVSAVSQKIGKVVVGGVLQDGDIGQWFAPSPNNKPDGPQRSGIGITRRDRKILQKAIHAQQMASRDGKKLITEIQSIIGTRENKDDVIQGVFEFLSSRSTPASMGARANRLADLMAQFIELAVSDAHTVSDLISKR